jgi:glycosyltransferase involved in cell wall biosynthesis
MKKKTICFIAQFPPPIHGLSKAVDTLYNSELSNEVDFEKVDITNNKVFLKNFILLWKSKADLFYFTISQSKGGNIRDLIILQLLKLQGKKCLIHLHGGYYRKLIDNDISGWQRKINYKIIKNLSGVIVLSPMLKSIFQGMIDEKKIFVVSNCVDNEFLISDSEFDEKVVESESKEVFNILYLSNFIRSKGFPEVLKMAKLEKERVAGGAKKRFHFNFAGKFFEDTEREFFENYIKEFNLQDFITYHGIVSGSQKKELLKRCDIFVLLTRYPIEGQPISIIEAMGNGMMVVTTDHAGIPDIVENYVNGILCNEDLEIDDLYEIISNMSSSNMQKIMLKNREKVKSNFRESHYLEGMNEVFSSSLDEPIRLLEYQYSEAE